MPLPPTLVHTGGRHALDCSLRHRGAAQGRECAARGAHSQEAAGTCNSHPSFRAPLILTITPGELSQEDTRRYADLLCDALGVASPAAAAQQLAAACASAEAALRAAALGADTGSGAEVPLVDADNEQPATWESAVAAASNAVALLTASRAAVTATGALEDVLHRLSGCAACAFPGTALAATVVLMRHVARTCTPLLGGSAATDAVACCVADGGILAALLAGLHGMPHSLWRLSDAQAQDLPLLLAAVTGTAGQEAGGGKNAAVGAYLAVAACTRTALRILRTAHDIDAASSLLSRVACSWPAPGALICALPGGGRAVSADGRGVSVELMGVASDADFQEVVTAWHAVTAAADAQGAAAGEATAAAVGVDDDSLFFFDVAGNAVAKEDDGDGEHGSDLDAWMGDKEVEEGRDEEDEP